MSAQQLYEKRVLPEAKYWLKELEYYGENQFKKKTEASEWTIGQVYEHVSSDVLQHFTNEMERCLKDKSTQGGKTFKGWLVFLFGTYMGRYKAVETIPAQPENLTKATDKMYRFLKETQRLAHVIEKEGTSGKTRHPVLGMLNAMEWYKLCLWHMEHHRKQKNRIDEILRKSPKEAFGEDL